MSDPAPVINPFRVVTFLYTVVGIILALPSVPAEWKTALAIASAVLSAVLLVFFGTPAASNNPSIARRVVNKLSKAA